jgi:hypothetical protein
LLRRDFNKGYLAASGQGTLSLGRKTVIRHFTPSELAGGFGLVGVWASVRFWHLPDIDFEAEHVRKVGQSGRV